MGQVWRTPAGPHSQGLAGGQGAAAWQPILVYAADGTFFKKLALWDSSGLPLQALAQQDVVAGLGLDRAAALVVVTKALSGVEGGLHMCQARAEWLHHAATGLRDSWVAIGFGTSPARRTICSCCSKDGALPA